MTMQAPMELRGSAEVGGENLVGRLGLLGIAPFGIHRIDLSGNVDLLMWQWARAANFQRLMVLRQNYLDSQTLGVLRHIERQRNIYTAYGIGLDHFGEKVNLGRPVFNTVAFPVFGWGPDNLGFNQAPFASPGNQHLTDVALVDQFYRPLIIIRAGMIVSDGSGDQFLATLERAMALFPGASVTVETTHKNVVVRFTGIPQRLFSAIEQSNVVEVPPGVVLTLELV